MSQAPRVIAVRVIERVVTGKESLDEAWGRFAGHLKAEDRPLVQALVYGSLRWLPWLEAQLTALTPRSDWRRDSLLRCLLVLGAWEAVGMATPPHAAVSETVAAARGLKRERASGMVNAVLRRLRREPRREPAAEAARYSFPEWLLTRLKRDWPDDWQQVVEALNMHPPMTLRVNLCRATRSAYCRHLEGVGMAAWEGLLAPSALLLERPCGVEELPGFVAGSVAVQDEAAQLAPFLLDPQPGERVLDACAAPGSKTVHLLEHSPQSEVIALDRSARRLRQVEQNLHRGGFEARCVAVDSAAPAKWWDGRPFERILLDAPCTATGVIRRHPDIKWLRGPDDAGRMATAQRRLLTALWSTLAPGGRLLYATCSLLIEENDEVVGGFVAEHADAELLPLTQYSSHARQTATGWQFLPGDVANTDGFFYSLLYKRS